MTPEQIIQEIKLSGLRGARRGGFPTGSSATCRQAAVHRGVEPIVVCNADEATRARSWIAASSRAIRTPSSRA